MFILIKSLLETKSLEALVHHRKRERNQSLKDSRAGPHSHVIPKVHEPGPGTYKNLEDAVVKTQEVKRDCIFTKSKRHTFIDRLSATKKVIPGVGTYTKKESAQDNCLSTPLSSLKRRR